MRLLAILAIWVMASGCEFPRKLAAEIDALKAVLTGKVSPLARDAKQTELERIARERAEVLQEMIRVTLEEDPRAEEFRDWLEALVEGASVEGIYNGLVSSARYRELEKSSGPAPDGALKLFAEAMARAQGRRQHPRGFARADALPLPEVVWPGSPDSPVPPAAARTLRTAAEFREFFSGASRFTLKRLLGATLLELLAPASPDRFSAYAEWAAWVNQQGVDLGLKERERGDAAFHEAWARAATPDQLTWEALNRAHRLLAAPRP